LAIVNIIIVTLIIIISLIIVIALIIIIITLIVYDVRRNGSASGASADVARANYRRD
jgi:heme/copper-type cytochrome/quinol oxidase subunit 2